MNPKDVALICWALARTDYPSEGPLAKKLASYIYHIVKKITDEEGYLYEPKGEQVIDTEEGKAEIDDDTEED